MLAPASEMDRDMRKRFIYTGIVVLLMLGGALALSLSSGGARTSVTTIDPALRTVVMVAPGEQRPLLSGADIAVDLEAGTLPAGVQRATVLSDEDCAADDQGVSHCLNELTIGGRQVAVRHHHNMMEEPCFSPTEQLNVMDVATYAALTRTAQ